MAAHCSACGSFVDGKPWEHDCPMYREEPPLSDIDDGFTVIPLRDPADIAESYRRYRRAIHSDGVPEPSADVGT